MIKSIFIAKEAGGDQQQVNRKSIAKSKGSKNKKGQTRLKYTKIFKDTQLLERKLNLSYSDIASVNERRFKSKMFFV